MNYMPLLTRYFSPQFLPAAVPCGGASRCRNVGGIRVVSNIGRNLPVLKGELALLKAFLRAGIDAILFGEE